MSKPKSIPLPPKPKLSMGSWVASIDNDFPARMPVDNPANNPADKPVEQPANNPGENPAGELANNPTRNLARFPVVKPALEPIEMPEDEPVDKPASNPTENQALNPAPIPAKKPVKKPVELPAGDPAGDRARDPLEKKFISLDATHTANEQKIYSWMYRNSISIGKNPRRFTTKELCKGVGIVPSTLGRNMQGLIDKLSIKVISRYGSNRYGNLYEVREPKTIFADRDAIGMEIEPGTKAIMLIRSGSFAGLSTGSSGGLPTGPSTGLSELRNLDTSESGAMYNTKNNLPVTQSSSVPNAGDDGKLDKVEKLFGQLSNGGTWKEERDLKAYEQIAHIGLFHIILGLCYSVSKSPEHRMSSLAYAVQSILKHADEMEEFPAEQLIEIAYRTKRTTLNCIQTGKWTVPEWEAGGE